MARWLSDSLARWLDGQMIHDGSMLGYTAFVKSLLLAFGTAFGLISRAVFVARSPAQVESRDRAVSLLPRVGDCETPSGLVAAWFVAPPRESGVGIWGRGWPGNGRRRSKSPADSKPSLRLDCRSGR